MSDLDFSVCFLHCWKKADPIEVFFTITLPTGEVVAKIVDYSLHLPRVCMFLLDFQQHSSEYKELFRLRTMFYMEKERGNEPALKKLMELMNFIDKHCNYDLTTRKFCEYDSCPYLPEMLVGGLNEEKQ